MTSFALAALGFLLFGMGASILAEMLAAGHAQNLSASGLTSLWRPLALNTVAGASLIMGYLLGYQAFRNIWVVTSVAVGCILIVEPILAYAMFRELPTRQGLISLCLGAAGLLAAIALS
jgi:hypothetical protein